MSRCGVVVGGGTAGTVVAARFRVLLLASGGQVDPHTAVDEPINHFRLWNGPFSFNERTVVQRATGRSAELSGRKALGGGPAMNGMLHVRGSELRRLGRGRREGLRTRRPVAVLPTERDSPWTGFCPARYFRTDEDWLARLRYRTGGFCDAATAAKVSSPMTDDVGELRRTARCGLWWAL